MEFEILVGAQLDKGQFSSLQEQIKSLGKEPIPIKLDFKEAKTEIENLQKQISKIGSEKSGNKINIITDKEINKTISSIKNLSSVIEKIKSSFEGLGKGTGLERIEELVTRATSAMALLSVDVKKISNSLGSINSESGMDNLLTSATDTAVALESINATLKKTQDMFSKMSGAFSKGFNMEFKVGGQDIVAKNEQIRKSSELAIKSLEEEISAVEKILDNGKGQSVKENVFNQLNAAFNKQDISKSAKFFDFYSEKYSKLSSKNSMSDTVNTLRQYRDYLREFANLKGVDLSSLSSINQQSQKFLEDSEKIRTGEQYLEEQTNRLKSIFGSGINSEALTSQLQNVIDKLTELTNVVSQISQVFSSGMLKISGGDAGGDSVTKSISDATQAYQRMKEIIKEMSSIRLNLNQLNVEDNAKEIDTLISRYDKLQSEYNNLQRTFSGDFTEQQNKGLAKELDTAMFKKSLSSAQITDEIDRIKAKVEEAKQALANDIQIKFDNGTISNETSKIEQEFGKLKEATTESSTAMEQFRTASTELHTAIQSGDVDRITSSYEKYQQALKTADNQIKINLRSEKEVAEAAKQVAREQETLSKSSRLSNDIQTWMNNNKKAAQEYGNELKKLQATLNGNTDAGKLKDVSNRFKEIKSEASAAGFSIKGFGTSLKDMALMTLGISGSYMAIQKGIQTVRQMFDEVLKVDTAMTELYRITDLSQQKYDSLFANMSNSAKEYGASLDDMINSTADWVRLGFEVDKSNRLAEITSMYQHVTDLDNDTAVDNLVTAYKGFESSLQETIGGDETKSIEYIADIYDKLGNEFAVSAKDVGEGVKRSASALQLAGNTIQESSAMITGMTEVTQMPEKSGSAIKILSLRLRGRHYSCLHIRKVYMPCA